VGGRGWQDRTTGSGRDDKDHDMNTTDAALLEQIAVHELTDQLPALELQAGFGSDGARGNRQADEPMKRLARLGLISHRVNGHLGRPRLTPAGLEALRYLCTT
jgi:hypothetical protein